MTLFTLLGYILIIIGFIVGIWGGFQFPIRLLNSEFMSFIVSASVLITLGVAFLKTGIKWIFPGFVWVTICLSIIYLVGFKMPIWVLACGIIVLLTIGWGTTSFIFK